MKLTKGVSILVLVLSWHMVSGAPLCLLGDFDSQVQQLLTQEMLTPQQLHNITAGNFHDLQEELRSRWGGAEVFLYGSLPTGLGTKNSDVDLYVRIPNHNDTADAYIVIETAQLLNNNPANFCNVKTNINKKVPSMSYYDIPKQRYVDLTFRSDALRSTKLISYFLQLDKSYIPLTAVIKFWGKLHHLTGRFALPDYAM